MEQSTSRTGRFQSVTAEDGGVGQRSVNGGIGAHLGPRTHTRKGVAWSLVVCDPSAVRVDGPAEVAKEAGSATAL